MQARSSRRVVGVLALALVLAGCTPRGKSPEFPSRDAPAPDIVGTDQDGKELRLSDYRGKVVMLDFWYSTCHWCVVMFPHQRSLVERMQGRPFALLGVSVDSTREELKHTVEQEKLPWRNWWDPEGKITDRWDVTGFPTVYLIDHKGVVRGKVDGAQPDEILDQAIDKLVEEAEKDGAR